LNKRTWRDFFNWHKDPSQTSNQTKQQPRRPTPRSLIDLPINATLTRGLFHGNFPGLKLASAMAFTPIAVPVWFMGIPTPKSENERTQETLNRYVEMYSRAMQQIHQQSHREGTAWIWPHYSARKQRVVWEFIPDETITDIVRDLDTGDVLKVVSDEEITLSTDYNKTATVRRRRTFTAEKITVEWLSGTSSVPGQLRNVTMRNPLGSIPIAFANNQDGDEVRGHSDYERILPDLKNYADIDEKRSILLAKFQPKMVQTVANAKEWMKNNAIDDINDIKMYEIDFILNVDGEKTEMLFLDTALDAYENALKTTFRKIVEGSGMPEILWGTKVEGNKASAQDQMDTLVKFVQDKQDQKVDSYRCLFAATAALDSMAQMQRGQEDDIAVEWNAMDTVSEETKSKIFQAFGQGVAALINSAGVTKDQLFRLWRGMYPDATEDDYNKFVVGLSEIAKHKSFKDSPYEIIADFEGKSAEGQT
jgi:hypothetical protein